MSPPQLPLELLLMVAHYLIDLSDDGKLPSNPADAQLYLSNLQSLRQVNRALFNYIDPIFWQKTLGAHAWLSERVLRPSIQTNDLARLTFFLNCGADIECPLQLWMYDEEASSPRPLLMACCLDNVPIARLLLESGAKIQYPPWLSPMHAARSAEMVQLLLDFHADPEVVNRAGERPLHHYVDRKNMATMRAILQRGADVNPASGIYGWTPLHRAAQAGSADAVKILLEFGADVTLRDTELNTPLHFAAKEGAIEVARLLLERWPEGVRARNVKSDTPLHRAAVEGNTEMIRLLLEIWAEGIRAMNADGDTLLHLAATAGKIEVLRLLVEFWPDGVQAKNEHLNTPLHQAAEIELRQRGNITPSGERLYSNPVRAEIVNFLVESWPEGVREKNKDGRTPNGRF
jgi:ankyrin repeat protein